MASRRFTVRFRDDADLDQLGRAGREYGDGSLASYVDRKEQEPCQTGGRVMSPSSPHSQPGAAEEKRQKTSKEIPPLASAPPDRITRVVAACQGVELLRVSAAEVALHDWTALEAGGIREQVVAGQDGSMGLFNRSLWIGSTPQHSVIAWPRGLMCTIYAYALGMLFRHPQPATVSGRSRPESPAEMAGNGRREGREARGLLSA